MDEEGLTDEQVRTSQLISVDNIKIRDNLWYVEFLDHVITRVFVSTERRKEAATCHERNGIFTAQKVSTWCS